MTSARDSGGALRAQTQSLNWAGFVDTGASGRPYTSVKGKWEQPAITCLHNNDEELVAFWVGIDGFSRSSQTVEQDGTLAFCDDGAKSYYGWWEMYPTNSIQVEQTIKPGDQIKASVSYSGGDYDLAVTDSTTPSGSFSKTTACGSGQTCANSSAEWISERPSSGSSYAVLPNFDAWSLSGGKVTSNGSKGVISSFTDKQVDMVDSSGDVLVDTSALNGSGNGFTCVWEAAS